MHMMVSKCWFPLIALGRGPTQSIIILLKGSPIGGIGCSGAGGMVWFGLPAIWQTWQQRQYLSTTTEMFKNELIHFCYAQTSWPLAFMCYRQNELLIPSGYYYLVNGTPIQISCEGRRPFTQQDVLLYNIGYLFPPLLCRHSPHWRNTSSTSSTEVTLPRAISLRIKRVIPLFGNSEHTAMGKKPVTNFDLTFLRCTGWGTYPSQCHAAQLYNHMQSALKKATHWWESQTESHRYPAKYALAADRQPCMLVTLTRQI